MVEGIEHVGEGLEDVVVARIDEIRAIKGADRVRLVIVDAGRDLSRSSVARPILRSGNHVPLAPVGAVLARGLRDRRAHACAASRRTACCARRVNYSLGDDHEGLMMLDRTHERAVGEGLLEALVDRARRHL